MSLVRRIARPAVLLAAVVGLPALPALAAEKLPMPRVTIYPGDIIAATMLTDGSFADGTAANFPIVASSDGLVGKVARRTLLPGHLIASNAIGEPDIVQRGTIVPAIYSDGALTITASVLALESGALNAPIQVRNVDSGKVIVGAVQADGSVRVGPPK